MLSGLIEFTMYILPLLAIVLGGIMFLNNINSKYRIILLIAIFLLTRYLLISSQTWELRIVQDRLKIFIQQNPMFYLMLSVLLGLIAAWFYFYPFKLNHFIVWRKRGTVLAVPSAVCGAAVMLFPFLAVYPVHLIQLSLLDNVPLWLSFLIFVVVGKALEVFIFQGYLQGYLKEKYSTRSAILFTTFLFSLCYIFQMAFIGQFVVWFLFYGTLMGLVLACLTHFFGIAYAITSQSLFYIILVSVMLNTI